jgi:heat-inducible transcriptional repressor
MSKNMTELTDRQNFILTLVIHDYIQNALPIGSQYLVEHYNLDMSPATVRNELSALDDSGYLYQPHTSAGRLPTDAGYRYFVGRLLNDTDLPQTTQRTISHQFYQSRQDMEQWMRLAASVLAHQSNAASVVTSPHTKMAHLKHIELISTRGRQVLMVLVLIGGEIHQEMLTLAEPVTQEQLSTSANRINAVCKGLDASSIEKLSLSLNQLEEDILKLMLQELRVSSSALTGEIFMDGFSNVLAEPEFANSEEARKSLKLLEERSKLENLLNRTVLHSSIGGVQVLIGGEGKDEDLRQCSVVLARYGVPGLATGTLGVLGPTRMYYGKTISTVRFMAGLLSDLVSDSLVE